MTLRQYIGWRVAFARLVYARLVHRYNTGARLAIAVALVVAFWPHAPRIDPSQPQLAVINFWVYVIVMLVSAIIAIAMAPKPPSAQPQKGQLPEATDGKSIVKAYGEVWIDDAMVLGFKTMGEDPIKKKGGKK